MFAIVSASRGQFDFAGLLIVLGGVADALDGRVARATGSGSRFGSELDSLVDVITFGLAPAMIMYFAVLNREGWEWLIPFLYVACAAIRLARFNVEQAGRAKRYFHGLPSPAAGMTLATYYWFSQTSLYNETILGDLPWHFWLRFLMLALAFLMISNVSYPAVPTIGYRTISEILGSLVVATTVIGVIVLQKQFYFPALVAYVLYGVAKTVFFGLIGRRPRGDVPVISDEDEDPSPTLRSRCQTSRQTLRRQRGTGASAAALIRATTVRRRGIFRRRRRKSETDDLVPRRDSHHPETRASRSAGESGRGSAPFARLPRCE